MRFIVSRYAAIFANHSRRGSARRGWRQGRAKDATRRYTGAGIVFLHSDGDHVTVCHFRHNYLCPALRAATRRVATRLRRARTNRVSRYAKAVTDQNKIESNAPLPRARGRMHTFRTRFTCEHVSMYRFTNLKNPCPLPFFPLSFLPYPRPVCSSFVLAFVLPSSRDRSSPSSLIAFLDDVRLVAISCFSLPRRPNCTNLISFFLSLSFLFFLITLSATHSIFRNT